MLELAPLLVSAFILGVLGGGHCLGIKPLEGLVETSDQCLVVLAHGRVRAGVESEHDNLP